MAHISALMWVMAFNFHSPHQFAVISNVMCTILFLGFVIQCVIDLDIVVSWVILVYYPYL